jgi:DNA-binding GntR family transcriptional regulator
MTVAQLKREDIVELYELREALEVYSAGKIARQPVRPADRDRLRLLVDQMLVLKKELEESEAQSLGKEQNQRFIDCDLGFHALLMSLTNNARMQRMVNDTRLLIRIFAIRRSGHTAAQLEGIHESHRRILDAVVEQSPLQAMQAMAEHIQVSQQERLNEYDSWRRETALRQHLPGIFEPKTQAGRP